MAIFSSRPGVRSSIGTPALGRITIASGIFCLIWLDFLAAILSVIVVIKTKAAYF